MPAERPPQQEDEGDAPGPADLEIWIDGGMAVCPGLMVDGEPHVSLRRLALCLDWAPVRFMNESHRVYLWTARRSER